VHTGVRILAFVIDHGKLGGYGAAETEKITPLRTLAPVQKFEPYYLEAVNRHEFIYTGAELEKTLSGNELQLV
jgi:hypothetical protein